MIGLSSEVERFEPMSVVSSENLREDLHKGVQAIGLQCPANAISQLLQFQALLTKWNKAYNLTAIREPEKMVKLHLLDSLVVSPYLSGFNILDVGTGAGLPGIPLALINPEKEFFLLDSNAKKTRFVEQVKLELKLPNVTVMRSRLEDFRSELKFDTIVSRAFSDLGKFVYSTRVFMQKGGVTIAMKARLSGSEIGQISDLESTVVPLRVPGVDAERNLVLVSS